MIACAGIIPLALVCGPIPLYVVRQKIKRLEALTASVPPVPAGAAVVSG